MEAFPGETVSIIGQLPESGLDVTWLKDNVPLSLNDTKHETVNNECSYELVVADITVEDTGEYTVKGGGYKSTVQLHITGWCCTQTER